MNVLIDILVLVFLIACVLLGICVVIFGICFIISDMRFDQQMVKCNSDIIDIQEEIQKRKRVKNEKGAKALMCVGLQVCKLVPMGACKS